MKPLHDLFRSPAERQRLASRGVFFSRQEFRSRLAPPVQPALAGLMNVSGKKLVCSGQQLYIDYRRSVLCKILSLRDFENDPSLFPFFLWLDTDRSGSDALITNFAWPAGSKKGSIRVAPPGTKAVEARFVRMEPSQLRAAADALETHLRGSGIARRSAKSKYLELRQLFEEEEPGYLSEFNHRLTSFLLARGLGYTPHSIILSHVINSGLITEEINLVVNHIDRVIETSNQTVQSLLENGIDPQVRFRGQDYLPLYYSCDVDDTRLPLHHVIAAGDHFAVAECRCGSTYRFFLGRTTLSIEEIAATKRWSPDVFMPGFFNDFVSGFIAGKSSVFYLLVINAVLDRVLGKTPVPILMPGSLAQGNRNGDEVDSLLYAYFNQDDRD